MSLAAACMSASSKPMDTIGFAVGVLSVAKWSCSCAGVAKYTTACRITGQISQWNYAK